MNNQPYWLHKSRQPCIIFPWQVPAPCPWPVTHERVIVSRKEPDKKGNQVDVLVVRKTSLSKRVNNTAIPQGRWLNLTR